MSPVEADCGGTNSEHSQIQHVMSILFNNLFHKIFEENAVQTNPSFPLQTGMETVIWCLEPLGSTGTGPWPRLPVRKKVRTP